MVSHIMYHKYNAILLIIVIKVNLEKENYTYVLAFKHIPYVN